MPEPDLGGNITGAQLGVIGTVLMAVGAGILKVVTMVADRFKSKDDRLAELERDRFKIVVDEWKSDREAANKTQTQTAEAMKELSAAIRDMKDAQKDGISMLNNVVIELKRSTEEIKKHA